MSGVNQFIKDNLEKVGQDSSRLHISPEIPAKKLTNAMNAFKYDGDPSNIIGLIDTTAFGSGKDGLLFTGSKLIYKEILQKPVSIDYENITQVLYEEVEGEKGKVTKYLHIEDKDDYRITIEGVSEANLEALSSLLKSISEDFEGFEEQSQLQPINELSDQLKIAYVKVIINMAYAHEGRVDDKEFSEILQLMTRLDIKGKPREEIRNYIASNESLVEVAELVNEINANTPDGMQKSIHISLVKDLISTHSATRDKLTSEFDFFQKNRTALSVTDEEIDLAIMAIEHDTKILNREYGDKIIITGVKELSAKAAAVGVPLGAVYLSGSVVGLSAAGMTSGLATLGMGGVLGLSSMATGIGAAVLIGVVAYKGLKHISGTGSEEGDKRREMMLQEVIRQSQKTTSLVIEDINYLTKSLNDALLNESVSKEKLQALGAKLTTYLNATRQISNRAEEASQKKARLASPEFLDLARLKAITGDSSVQRFFDMIMESYELVEIQVEDKEGNSRLRQVYKLRNDLSEDKLRVLGEAFNAIGYSTTSGALKGKASEVKSRIGGLFS